ncbi:tryptophan-rich sensory protein [Candidatus Pelagibacter sp.]|nr:tryptophan-rich sensory protein [Candidatus Pelagibacter sp.]
MKKYNFISLIFFLLSTFIVSTLTSIVTLSSKEPWYSSLKKPPFNPPDWIFGPVWTMLYFLMAIAIWNVWIKNFKHINVVFLYFIQLFFNATWSIIFFVFQNILLSVFNLMILIFLIVILIIKYKHISNLSVIIMIPYLLWCLFAFFLNTSIWILN